MPLRALICDDEAPARDEMRFLLEQAGGVEVTAETGVAADALRLIASGTFDVVFLDVVMPGLTGLQLAEALAALDRRPAVVFVTGHSEHAVEAFQLAAADYLLKPVEPARLRATLARLDPVEATPVFERLAVEKSGKKLLIPVDKIRYVMADGDYSYLVTDDGKFLSSYSLTLLETRLDADRFMRIHRRYLVNLASVSEVVPMYGGTMLLALSKPPGTELPVSRRRSRVVKEMLGL